MKPSKPAPWRLPGCVIYNRERPAKPRRTERPAKQTVRVCLIDSCAVLRSQACDLSREAGSASSVTGGGQAADSSSGPSSRQPGVSRAPASTLAPGEREAVVWGPAASALAHGPWWGPSHKTLDSEILQPGPRSLGFQLCLQVGSYTGQGGCCEEVLGRGPFSQQGLDPALPRVVSETQAPGMHGVGGEGW